MKLIAEQSSILHSRASVLILGLSSEGTVLSPTVERLMGLYPCFYRHYKEQAQTGELKLGDIIAHTVQKQATGLSVGTNAGATHLIGAIVQAHPTQSTKALAWQTALKAIDGELYQLMRYKGIRHIALLAPKDNEPSLQESSCAFWQKLQRLNTPRVRLDVHFDKMVDISGFVQIVPTQT